MRLLLHLALALAHPTPAVYECPDPAAFSRVVAVSDVHGQDAALGRLLVAGGLIDGRGRWRGGKTLVIVVGDSIDKGPASLAVLDRWRALAAEAPAVGGRVVHLLGNHEAAYLADPAHPQDAAFGRGLQGPAGRGRRAYLQAMPLAARVGKWLFCHAGLYPDLPWPAFRDKATATLAAGDYGAGWLLGDDTLLTAKGWWRDRGTRRKLEQRLWSEGLYGVVHGHMPHAYDQDDRIGSIDGGRLVKIDCGMSTEAGSHPGELLIMPEPTALTREAPPPMRALDAQGRSRPLKPEMY